MMAGSTCVYCPSARVVVDGKCPDCGRVAPYELVEGREYVLLAAPTDRTIPVMPWLEPPKFLARISREQQVLTMARGIKARLGPCSTFRVLTAHRGVYRHPWYRVKAGDGTLGYVDSSTLLNWELAEK